MKNKKKIDTQDSLDQFIKNNLEAFDEEPAAGHRERFEARRMSASLRRRVMWLRVQIAVAASVTILVALYALWPSHKPAGGEVVIVCEQTADMKSCYLSKMNDMVAQIDNQTQNMDKWDRQLVQNEVTNIMTSAGDIEEMLPAELPVEEAKQILSGYYKQSLESLETIAQLVNENNNPQK